MAQLELRAEVSVMRRIAFLSFLLALVLGGCTCRDGGGEVGAPGGGAVPTTPEPQGTGTLEIRASSDFPFRVVDASGQEVASGTCNIHQPELPPGTYRAVISASGTDVTVGPATVEPGEKATLKLEGFGTLKVGAPKDFMKFEVKDAAGEVVASGDTNITTVGLPVGTYSVEVATSPFPPTTIDGVTVEEGAQASPVVHGFGFVTIKASRDFVDYKVIDAEGREVGSGQTNITSLLLPVGDFTVVAGDAKTPLTVADGDDKNVGIAL